MELLVAASTSQKVFCAQTNVLVANGDTTVIGGVFSTESATSIDRVPGFHKIPVLGKHSKEITCGACSQDNRLALGSKDKNLTIPIP